MPLGMWDLPRPGIQSVSLTLQERFLTREPPEKALKISILSIVSYLLDMSPEFPPICENLCLCFPGSSHCSDIWYNVSLVVQCFLMTALVLRVLPWRGRGSGVENHGG